MLVSFVLYGNSLKNGYTIDDHYVADNELVQKGLKALPEIFESYYAENENGNTYEYRPLVKASFALENIFFKHNPFFSHFINLLLYGLILYLIHAFLIVFMVRKNELYIFFTVIFFAVLPIHTEVVDSLKNRDILLAFVFTISSLLSFDKYLSKQKYMYLIFGGVSIVFAFFSKLDVLPFIVIGPLLLYRKYKMSFSKTFLFISVFLFGFIILGLVKDYMLDPSIGNRTFYNFETPLARKHSAFLAFLVSINTLGFYLKNFIFPSHLSCYYGMETIPLTVMNIYSALAFSGIIFSLYYLIKKIKHQDDIWMGLMIMFATISMFLNIIKPLPGIIAERTAFFSSLGYIIVFSQILIRGKDNEIPVDFKSWKIPYKFFFIVVLIVFSLQTILRNTDWKNNLTLYGTDVKKWPSSVKLNVLYGNEIISNINKNTGLIKPFEIEKYIDDAQKYLKTAYHLDSSYYNSANSIAYIELSFKNNPKEAINWLYKSQRNDTINYEIPLNLCLAFIRLNNIDSAEYYFLKTNKIKSADTRLVQYMNDLYQINNQSNRGKNFFLKYFNHRE